jgi:hypothetical protein
LPYDYELSEPAAFAFDVGPDVVGVYEDGDRWVEACRCQAG